MPIALLTMVSAAAVAWANGANDISKGVATLVGSRVPTYTQALQWGTLWTVAGAIGGLMLTTAMVKTFSTALIAGDFARSPEFPVAVATGTFLWVFIGSKTGLPVSTTHALTGAIVGIAMAAGGLDGIRWSLAATSVALPLAFSPLASALIAYGTHTAVSRRLTSASRYCICARERALMLSTHRPIASPRHEPSWLMRRTIPILNELYREFGDRVAFLTVYVRQAHPGERYPQPETFERKLAHARIHKDRDQIPWPIARSRL